MVARGEIFENNKSRKNLSEHSKSQKIGTSIRYISDDENDFD